MTVSVRLQLTVPEFQAFTGNAETANCSLLASPKHTCNHF